MTETASFCFTSSQNNTHKRMSAYGIILVFDILFFSLHRQMSHEDVCLMELFVHIQNFARLFHYYTILVEWRKI